MFQLILRRSVCCCFSKHFVLLKCSAFGFAIFVDIYNTFEALLSKGTEIAFKAVGEL